MVLDRSPGLRVRLRVRLVARAEGAVVVGVRPLPQLADLLAQTNDLDGTDSDGV